MQKQDFCTQFGSIQVLAQKFKTLQIGTQNFLPAFDEKDSTSKDRKMKNTSLLDFDHLVSLFVI